VVVAKRKMRGQDHNSLSVIQESCALCCASWVVLLASDMRESCCSNEGTLVFLVGWWIYGVYPMSRSNVVFFMVANGQEFLAYYVSGSHLLFLVYCFVVLRHHLSTNVCGSMTRHLASFLI
jgi:hypothetical protein